MARKGLAKNVNWSVSITSLADCSTDAVNVVANCEQLVSVGRFDQASESLERVKLCLGCELTAE
jgi:hypothetical protein